jgi:hypothetical protein
LPRFIFITGFPCGNLCSRLHNRLARFAANELGYPVTTLAQELLKSTHHGDPFAS